MIQCSAMPNTVTPSPQRQRLRAAAALIPIIRSALADLKLAPERAAHMTNFVEWASVCVPEGNDEKAMLKQVKAGLQELKSALEARVKCSRPPSPAAASRLPRGH